MSFRKAEKETNIYSLIGVIAHSGSLNLGHYICYTKRGDHVSSFYFEKCLT